MTYGVNDTELLKLAEHRGKMRRRLGPARTLEPILVEERGKTGLAKLNFPQNTEQRGKRLLALALHAEECRGALGRSPVTGLGAGAEAEIDQHAAFRRRDLEMRDLMQQHIGLGVAAESRAVPAEVECGTSR